MVKLLQEAVLANGMLLISISSTVNTLSQTSRLKNTSEEIDLTAQDQQINGGSIADGTDLPLGNSAKPGSGTDTNRRPNDSPSVEPPGPPSFNRLPLDPKRFDELTNALPEEWRSRVTIFADSAASGRAVRVYYQPDVAIGVGPAASAADIELHIPTVRLLLRYSGWLGRIHALLQDLRNWITRNGEPRIGTVAWEAKLELQKLPDVIAERQARLSKTNDRKIQRQLEAEIASFEAQIDRHQKNLAQMNANPGKGFIAAEIDPKARNFFTRVEETTGQLRTTIEEILPNRPIEENMSDDQKNELKNLADLREKLLTRVDIIATRNTELLEAEKQFYQSDDLLYESDDLLDSVEQQIENDKQ